MSEYNLTNYNHLDIKILKNVNDETNDYSYCIAVITHDNNVGGRIIQKLDLNDYLFDLLCKRIDMAKEILKELYEKPNEDLK